MDPLEEFMRLLTEKNILAADNTCAVEIVEDNAKFHKNIAVETDSFRSFRSTIPLSPSPSSTVSLEGNDDYTDISCYKSRSYSSAMRISRWNDSFDLAEQSTRHHQVCSSSPKTPIRKTDWYSNDKHNNYHDDYPI